MIESFYTPTRQRRRNTAMSTMQGRIVSGMPAARTWWPGSAEIEK
ncbi:MAG TPA: hypothetical protein VNF73_04805 [Candidatus Saccharimonadales bacterium]|nr:hypothetical protein [Candidatus Saccharimonadales bacterium]